VLRFTLKVISLTLRRVNEIGSYFRYLVRDPQSRRNLNKDKLLIFIDGCDNEKHEITYIYDTKQV